MLPLRLYANNLNYRFGLAIAACLALLLTATPTFADLGAVGFQVNISEKEMILEHPNDMGVKMFASWDAPYQRIADRNMPTVEVKNLDESTGNLTEFSMTIGDTDYNFSDDYFGDYIVLGNSTPNIDIASVTSNGDLLTVSFGNGGLAPGALVRFRIDLDPDANQSGLYPHPDFRTVLFDMNDMDGNGMADNSVVSAMFEDPNDSSMTASAFTELDDFDVTGPQSQYFNQVIRPYSVMEGVDTFGTMVLTTPDAIPEPATAVLAGLALAGAAVWRRRQTS